jgi:hypothetical protein
VRARLPLYGYLMLQQALSGGASIAGRALAGECKAWLLRGRKAGDLRLLVVNKDGGGKECGANLALTPEQLRRHGDAGQAHYMYAFGGLDERWRVYYSGSFFSLWGADKEGAEKLVPVRRHLVRDAAGRVTGGGFAVHLTSNTLAALVVVPPATAAQQKAFDALAQQKGASGGWGGSGVAAAAQTIAKAPAQKPPAPKPPTPKAPAGKPPPAPTLPPPKAPAGKAAPALRAL